MIRLERLLDSDARESFSPAEIAEALGCSAQDAILCFARLAKQNRIVPAGMSIDKARSWKWEGKSIDKDTRCSPAPWTSWFLGAMSKRRAPVLEAKEFSAKCPRCGEPIKGKHGRSGFHDQKKCDKRTVEVVMGE